MGTYIIRRILLAIPVWILISIFAFALVHLAKSSPAAVLLGGSGVSKAEIARENALLGLNRPLLTQYFSWLGNALHGNFGNSYFLDTPVARTLWTHAVVTASIAVPAVLLSIGLGLLGGVVSGVKANTKIDAGVTIGTTIGMSLPEFWLAMLLILAFSVGIKLFPPLGYAYPWQAPLTWLHEAVLPAATIGLIQSAPIARMVRASLIEVLNADFVRTARAKGIPERRVIFVHALRAALLPILTSLGVIVMLVLAGNFIVEVVFNIPGLGYLMVNSALQSDYPVLQAGMLLVGTVVIVINLLTDVAYAWADPRVRYG